MMTFAEKYPRTAERIARPRAEYEAKEAMKTADQWQELEKFTAMIEAPDFLRP